MILVSGFLVSLLLWAVLVSVSLSGGVYLYKERVLPDRWLLIVPYLFASLLFLGCRYRFPYWYYSAEQVYQFFSIGAFWEADRIVFFVCIPLFYAISVLKPEWVVRLWVNVPLVVFLPFALKLFLYFTGLVHWDQNPAQLMPSRLDG